MISASSGACKRGVVRNSCALVARRGALQGAGSGARRAGCLAGKMNSEGVKAHQPNSHEDKKTTIPPRNRNEKNKEIPSASITRMLSVAMLVPLPFIGTLDISFYGGALLLLAAFEFTIFARNVTRPPTATLAIVLILLASGVFDNSLVAFGATIGVGTLLENLSFVRYFLHSTAVPFLLVPCAELYRESWRTIAFIVAGALAVSEAVMLFPPAWVPRTFAGTLRLLFNDITEGMPFPIVTIGVSLVVLVVGWLIRRKSGDNTLLAGALASFVGNALPASQVGTLPGALGEGLLFLSIIMAERKMVQGKI